MNKGHRLGAWGENLARVFLEGCGYRCLAQRYRQPGGEIDLVMCKENVLVFVEVKTRGPGSLAPAAEWFRPRQLQLLRRMALLWLQQHPAPGHDELRFDLVSIDVAGDDGGTCLRHLTNVG